MNKKLILYIGGFELPDKNAAAQRVTVNAKIFKKLGFETLLIGMTQKKAYLGKREFESFNYYNLSYPKTIMEWITYLICFKQYIRFLNGKYPNVIIAYNLPAIALNQLRKWSQKRRIPIISDCTEWYEPKGNFIFRIIKGFDVTYRMKNVHLKLDGLIAISNYLYSYYSEKMNNVIEIPPLVDLSMRKWNVPKIKYNDNIIRYIYAGSPGIGNKDKIDLILKILAKINAEEPHLNFEFIIIGISEEQYIKNFRKKIPENLKNRICFKGRLSHIDTLNEIKKADFNLFIRENNLANRAGFPTKFAESISCGTPVLTNSLNNIKEYISKGETGYLLDVSNEKTLQHDLKNTLTIPRKQILTMKKICTQSQIFDYRRFISKFNILFNNIENSHE